MLQSYLFSSYHKSKTFRWPIVIETGIQVALQSPWSDLISHPFQIPQILPFETHNQIFHILKSFSEYCFHLLDPSETLRKQTKSYHSSITLSNGGCYLLILHTIPGAGFFFLSAPSHSLYSRKKNKTKNKNTPAFLVGHQIKALPCYYDFQVSKLFLNTEIVKTLTPGSLYISQWVSLSLL